MYILRTPPPLPMLILTRFPFFVNTYSLSPILPLFYRLSGIRLKEHDLQTFITWFDTNGSDCLDYNELVRELFGDDILTRSSSSLLSSSLLSSSSSSFSSSLPMVTSPSNDAKQRMKMLAALKKSTETSPSQLGLGSSAIR